MLEVSWKYLTATLKEQILELEGYYLENIYNADEMLSFLVFLDDNKVIAYMSFKEYDEAYDVYNVVVADDYQRRGYAIEMFSHLMDKDIYLEVSEVNFVALNLYRKLGFIKINQIKNYYKDDLFAYVMKRNKTV